MGYVMTEQVLDLNLGFADLQAEFFNVPVPTPPPLPIPKTTDFSDVPMEVKKKL